MQLTRFTDFGLRVLMYLTHQDRSEPVTITEISECFQISRNHLVKVVHFMGKRKWIVTTRGKGGGLALANTPESYRLGDLIRELEDCDRLIDCVKPSCPLNHGCQLSAALAQAQAQFFATLNQYTLADMLRAPTGLSIIQLHRDNGH